MTSSLWLSFISATTILCFTPGPLVILVIGQTLVYGKKSILPLSLGILLGDVLVMSVSLWGLGVILSRSTLFFKTLTYLGILYLLILGIKTFLTKPVTLNDTQATGVKQMMFKDAFVVAALNPKAIIFFTVFLPMFINYEQAIPPQFAILLVSHLLVSATSIVFYAYHAAKVGHKFKSPNTKKTLHRISGLSIITVALLVLVFS